MTNKDIIDKIKLLRRITMPPKMKREVRKKIVDYVSSTTKKTNKGG